MSLVWIPLAGWLQGAEPAAERTRDFLHRQLTQAQALGCWPNFSAATFRVG
ncbi:MAG: hypothetical protein Q8L93_09045 [Rhodocyclaceae bacterium]|nr:hypothetical protein [Rhodocyclaceae bacterium]